VALVDEEILLLNAALSTSSHGVTAKLRMAERDKGMGQGRQGALWRGLDPIVKTERIAHTNRKVVWCPPIDDAKVRACKAISCARDTRPEIH